MTSLAATAQFTTALPRVSVTARRISYVLTAIVAAFLMMDAVIHIMHPAFAVDATVKLGYPGGMLLPLGIIEATGLALYLIPATSAFGALLWTGYLGGAVATHVRAGDPLFTHILAPIYVAVMLWGALYMRDPRLRSLVSFRRG